MMAELTRENIENLKDLWEAKGIHASQFVVMDIYNLALKGLEAEKLTEQRNALLVALIELLRLYDWRNELAAAAEKQFMPDQKQELLTYGREKKAAWKEARAAITAVEGK